LNAPRDLGAIVADLGKADTAAEAAIAARAVGDAALLKARATANRHWGATAAAWRGMSPFLRELFVSMYTETPAGRVQLVAQQPWDSFSTAERCAIGAAARQLHRETERAGWLR